VKFLVDRCAGHRLADWLRAQGHDVSEVVGPDPGDEALLARATVEERVLVTIDTDFGELIYAQGLAHRGLVRLPDVLAVDRIALMQAVLAKHEAALAEGAVITVRGKKIRISRQPK
jgi:predicted nuclease of predicted toxin-antitoxin system